MQCHAPVPRLNAFGEAFAANGFEFAVGEPPRDTVGTGDALLRLQNDLPLAIRYDAYLQGLTKPTSGNDNAIDFQTPWVIKLLSGGQVSDKISYYIYFLLTERGEVEGLEDAYLQFTDVAGSGVSLHRRPVPGVRSRCSSANCDSSTRTTRRIAFALDWRRQT